MRTLLALTCWTRRSHNPMRDPPGQRCPRRSEALALTSGLQNFSRARPVILYTFPDPDVLLLLSARRRLIALVYNFPCRGRTGSRLASRAGFLGLFLGLSSWLSPLVTPCLLSIGITYPKPVQPASLGEYPTILSNQLTRPYSTRRLPDSRSIAHDVVSMARPSIVLSQ